jgi:hypothetical protein
MAYRIITLKSAAEDISEAYNYYEGLQTGLGDRFLAELIKRYNEISVHPQYYGFIDDQKIIRDVKLKKFPYLVVYEIKDEFVVINSVHNTYRNPDKRLRNNT